MTEDVSEDALEPDLATLVAQDKKRRAEGYKAGLEALEREWRCTVVAVPVIQEGLVRAVVQIYAQD